MKLKSFKTLEILSKYNNKNDLRMKKYFSYNDLDLDLGGIFVDAIYFYLKGNVMVLI